MTAQQPTRRFDRRALFASGAAAALLAATGLSAHAAPQRGGALRIAVPRDGAMAHALRGAMFETLTEIAPDKTLRSSLATDWQRDGSGTIWQFSLNPAARFHDGAPVTPDDVIASLLRADLPDLVAAEATGPHQLSLRLSQPSADLPLVLAALDYVIAPAGQTDLLVGSGLYRVRRHDPDRNVLLHRVDTHPRDGHAGWADRVEMTVIPDDGVRAEALRDGFVDIAVMPRPGLLRARDALTFHPSAEEMALAAHPGVGVPPRIGDQSAMDDGRLIERWWVL